MRTELLLQTFIENMKDIYTQIPGHVLAFDPGTQLAQVQIGILIYDDKDNASTPAPIIECPVHFAGDSEWHIEHKITPKSEGMIFFSQRCVDGWIQTGGVAQNPIARFHDKQDAFFLPGFRSKPNAISDFQNNGVRIRSKDASVSVWLKDDGTIEAKNSASSITQLPNGQINAVNSADSINMLVGGINITSTGPINLNGFIISPAGLMTDSSGTSFHTHTHSQGVDSDNDSQQETNPPTVGS